MLLGSRARPQCDWRSPEVLMAAVGSLYADQLLPCHRVLRKRLLEVCGARPRRLDIPLGELRKACDRCQRLAVQDIAESEWLVTIRGQPGDFIDAHEARDVYPEAMWEQAAAYLAKLPPHAALPGGRIACAQQLMRAPAPFVQGYSLGKVAHIVHLSITERHLLAYLGNLRGISSCICLLVN